MPVNDSRSTPRRARRRLSVEDRREQLLAVGLELFATRAYEEVWLEEIAEKAGVSRGLLYHYYPTKRDFYVAVSRKAAAEASEVTTPDPELAPADQLRAGIEAFVRYAEEHSEGFLTAWRGASSGDPDVRAIGEQARQRHAARILDAISREADPSPLLRLAVRGWVALAQQITSQWLADQQPPRAAVNDLLAQTLLASISAAENIASDDR